MFPTMHFMKNVNNAYWVSNMIGYRYFFFILWNQISNFDKLDVPLSYNKVVYGSELWTAKNIDGVKVQDTIFIQNIKIR